MIGTREDESAPVLIRRKGTSETEHRNETAQIKDKNKSERQRNAHKAHTRKAHTENPRKKPTR